MHFRPVAACRNVTKLRANATRASSRVAACRDRVGDTISLIINYKCFCHPVGACRDPTRGWIEKMILILNLVTLRHAATLRVSQPYERVICLIEACLGEPSSYCSVSQPYERVICLIEACLGEPSSYRSVSQPYERVICLIEACLGEPSSYCSVSLPHQRAICRLRLVSRAKLLLQRSATLREGDLPD